VQRGSRTSTSASWTLSVIAPFLFISLILGADLREGPKTAYVGVLTAVPFFAAIFGSPVMTAVTAVITWISALAFGLIASDGNAPAQTVRLIIIAVAGVIAVGASYVRQRRDVQFREAQRVAAEAEALRIQAGQDALTGLLNRRGVYERLAAEEIRDGTVIVIDCDDFKEVNDTHGHLVGDEFLCGIAGRLGGAVAGDDLIARWGGDEFLILVRGPFAEGSEVAARVVGAVSSRPMSTAAGLIPVSLSAGAAPLSSSESLDQALAAADRAMYDAKSRGRGQIVLDPTSDGSSA
jgi:diguanylate cyclase (GGDEF)-like protein